MAQSATGTGITQEINITDDNTTNGTVYLTWATGLTGSQSMQVSSSKFLANPFTGTITASIFAGNLTGNASTVTTNANLTGEVTSVGNAATITADAVTNTKLANMATATFKARVTAGTGDPEDATVTQMKTALSIPRVFSSSPQTITASGALTIAHGLGATPFAVTSRLVCVTAEAGYIAGDSIFVTGYSMLGDRGAAIFPDVTNINIRYGASGTTYSVPHKTTGNVTNLTNANWNVVFTASAIS